MDANLISSIQPNRHMGIESRFTAEQIEAFKRFEDEEIDRFLKEYFPYKETKIWLPEMTKEQFPFVRVETKKGIKEGIEDFLKSEGMEGLSLYLADLGIFVWSNYVRIRVKELLLSTFDEKDVSEYSEYVDDSYRGFIYQISIDDFKKQFGFE